jgi:hypothetical protein
MPHEILAAGPHENVRPPKEEHDSEDLMKTVTALLCFGVMISLLPAYAALITYSDRSPFNAAAPGLAVETFEAGLVAAGGVTACNGPLNITTASACFAAGALLPNVTYSAVPGTFQPNMVVLGAGVAGNLSKVVGPNLFADMFNLTFGAANAVGFDVFPGPFAGTVVISVFSPTSVLLNSFSISASRGPNFFGIVSDAGTIGRINVASQSPSPGELIDNLAFGSAVVPEPASYMLLASGLGLSGLLKLKLCRRI